MELTYFDRDLETQRDALLTFVEKNEVVNLILNQAAQIGLPNWYLGAGCITQTVWNALSNRPLLEGIKDADLVFFDASDISEEAESRLGQRAKDIIGDIPLKLDVKNQARVHLWYERKFGQKIRPYCSVEDAINTWPTTATAIGITKNENDNYRVYAPFGLNDLFSMIVRANKVQITKKIYTEKVERWQKHWPSLKIIAWNDENITEVLRLRSE